MVASADEQVNGNTCYDMDFAVVACILPSSSVPEACLQSFRLPGPAPPPECLGVIRSQCNILHHHPSGCPCPPPPPNTVVPGEGSRDRPGRSPLLSSFELVMIRAKVMVRFRVCAAARSWTHNVAVPFSPLCSVSFVWSGRKIPLLSRPPILPPQTLNLNSSSPHTDEDQNSGSELCFGF